MNSRVEKAIELHKLGYNCSQAVLCAYCDMFNMDEQTAFKIAEGFGAGMGIQSVCGALTGLIMLAGLNNSSGTYAVQTKASTYKLSKELSEKFKNKNGSIICAELKGLNTGKPLRSCTGCIQDACEIFEQNFATLINV